MITLLLIGFGVAWLTFGAYVVPAQSQITGTYIYDLPFYDSVYLDSATSNLIDLAEFGYDDYIVFLIDLDNGEGVDITLNVPSDVDFDLHLIHAEGNSIVEDMSSTGGTGTTENIQFISDTFRTYGIVIAAYSGTGWADIDVQANNRNAFDIGVILPIIFGVIGLILFVVIISRCCCGRKAKRVHYQQPPPAYPPQFPPQQGQGSPRHTPPPAPTQISPPSSFPEKGILEPEWQPDEAPLSPPPKAVKKPATALKTCEACGNTLPHGETLCTLCGYKNPE